MCVAPPCNHLIELACICVIYGFQMLVSVPIHLMIQDGDGNTALHVAVLTQHVQVVSLLMEAGADPTRINFRIITPIFEAARIGLTA